MVGFLETTELDPMVDMDTIRARGLDLMEKLGLDINMADILPR
jgi:hypothetical protein